MYYFRRRVLNDVRIFPLVENTVLEQFIKNYYYWLGSDYDR
jgi:hypothetical protein